MRSGLWILCGVLIFTIIEKIFSGYANANKSNNPTKSDENGNGLSEKKGSQPIKISGYLNLIANSIDNFTNGLAVAGSFLVSFHHGFLGLLAILCEIRNYSICYNRTLIIMMFVCLFFFRSVHEIPHEVGDFAILLRSGFSRWDAAKAQLLTAFTGVIGALLALSGSNVTNALEVRTSWVMPFTAGGFLHISLVTVLPDLMKETDPKESIKQWIALIAGIALMATLNIVFES